MSEIFDSLPSSAILSKRESAMLRELLCPRCRGELRQAFDGLRIYSCRNCLTTFFGEEKGKS